EGYSLNTPDVSTVFNAPLTNEPYSKISGDFNPIHVNPYFSDFASLPTTITHGLWSSAATRCYVENIVAHGHPDRMIAYDAKFVGMVLPGDELTVIPTVDYLAVRRKAILKSLSRVAHTEVGCFQVWN
ncbi:hypothetical protein BYT27DRAFT_7293182, partial [Phlegmacium glaucopus]